MKTFACWFLFLIAVFIAMRSISTADKYVERSLLTLKTDLSIKTVNGDSSDYANLEAFKEIEKSVQFFKTFADVTVLMIFFVVTERVFFARKYNVDDNKTV